MIGKEFYGLCGDYNTVTNTYGHYYQVKTVYVATGETRSDLLYTPDQITDFLNRQDELKGKAEKCIESEKRFQEQEAEKVRLQAEQEREYNNTNGYTDDMTNLQKGKVLKVLNTVERYNISGKAESMKRKDFIKFMVDNENRLEHKKDVRHWGKKGITIKENEYRAYLPDNSFYVITKTEYDYGMYLTNKMNEVAV